MKYLKSYESMKDSKRLYTGDEVWEIASKGGSEHNDALEYLEDDIKRNNYYLLDIPVSVAIKGDIDIDDIINVHNMKNDDEYKSYREITQPIIIGRISRGGPDIIDGIIDGSNRLSQALNNGQETIKSFVSTDSTYLNL